MVATLRLELDDNTKAGFAQLLRNLQGAEVATRALDKATESLWGTMSADVPAEYDKQLRALAADAKAFGAAISAAKDAKNSFERQKDDGTSNLFGDIKKSVASLMGNFEKVSSTFSDVGLAAQTAMGFIDKMADQGSVAAKRIQTSIKSATDDLVWGAGKLADEMAKSFDAGPVDMLTRSLRGLGAGFEGLLKFQNPMTAMMKNFTGAGIEADADKAFEEMKAKAARSKAAVIDEMKNGGARSSKAMDDRLKANDANDAHRAELDRLGNASNIDYLRQERDSLAGQARHFAAENTNPNDAKAEATKNKYVELHAAANRRIAELEKQALKQQQDDYDNYRKGREAVEQKAREAEKERRDDRIADMREEADRQRQQFEWLRSTHQLSAEEEKKMIKDIQQVRKAAFEEQRKAFEQDAQDTKDENERRAKAIDNQLKLERQARDEQKKIQEEITENNRREIEKRLQAQQDYESKIAAALKHVQDAANGGYGGGSSGSSGGSSSASSGSGGSGDDQDYDEDGQPTEGFLRKKRNAANKRKADRARARSNPGASNPGAEVQPVQVFGKDAETAGKAFDKMSSADKAAFTDKVNAAYKKQEEENRLIAAARERVAKEKEQADKEAALAKKAGANNPAAAAAPAPTPAAPTDKTAAKKARAKIAKDKSAKADRERRRNKMTPDELADDDAKEEAKAANDKAKADEAARKAKEKKDADEKFKRENPTADTDNIRLNPDGSRYETSSTSGNNNGTDTLASGISDQSQATMQLANTAGSGLTSAVNLISQNVTQIGQLNEQLQNLKQQLDGLGERSRAMA